MAVFDAISRRRLFIGTGALFAWAHVPRLARAQGRDPRFLVVILRGALDGLAAVPPVGDPDWVSVRGDNALQTSGQNPARKLDDFFALHPAMPNLYRLYGAGQAVIVHASATGYRDRSHFDGQDVLESGQTQPGSATTGWLNRALGSLAPEGRLQGDQGQLLAVGPVTPLVARGPAPVLAWAPQRVPPANEDTVARLEKLYSKIDPEFARTLQERMKLADLNRSDASKPTQESLTAASLRAYFTDAMAGAAKVLANPDGPRIGALALDGWDTHADEGVKSGRLSTLLGSLDAAIGATEAQMGPAWSQTAMVIVTEFGRTVRINGSAGTDHGTATVAFVVGGAVKGGRVVADWPGLKPKDQYEQRDLKPTTDVRAVLKGLLRDQLQVDVKALGADVFPGTAAMQPTDGLIA